MTPINVDETPTLAAIEGKKGTTRIAAELIKKFVIERANRFKS